MKLFDENNLTAVYEENPKGGFIAFIPEIDGIVSEGATMEEAEENLMEQLRILNIVTKRDEWKRKKGLR
jgi:predicted RNase H-like HicB family nuclease